jgi:hypothetical protein
MTKRFENVAHKLDNTWVEEELIPLLVTAYGELECGQWMQSVQAAAETLDEWHALRMHCSNIVANLPSQFTRTSTPRLSAFVCF